MIKYGVINGAKGIFNYIPTQEEKWKNQSDLTNKVVYSMCGNLIEQAEAIRSVEESGLNGTVGIIARSFLELFVQFKFVLQNETEKRAKSFYFNYKLESSKKIQLLLQESAGDLTHEELEKLNDEVEGIGDYDSYVAYYKSLADSLYDNPKNHSQKWYNLHGEKRKFKELMIECGFKERDYTFFYGLGSMDTHGNSSAANINLTKTISFESFISTDYIDEAITRWLNTAVSLLAKFYEVENTRKVKLYQTQIAISHIGLQKHMQGYR
ncbi:hypothetical protein AUF12_14040 [Enterococcus avium]|uniref:DUF5677 domain-containing protein n=1 Tax=Enterococcus avium TaxID=33945 RepID=UPI000C9B4388|nr:DUF5677 domain-containing protein [Enterococcus avium]PNE51542.1 hypothetical protein AUF12_14040 [Enterococcus avium]